MTAELGGMPAPDVRIIDRVSGTILDQFATREALPNVDDERMIGSYEIICVSVTETKKDGRTTFVATWKIVE